MKIGINAIENDPVYRIFRLQVLANMIDGDNDQALFNEIAQFFNVRFAPQAHDHLLGLRGQLNARVIQMVPTIFQIQVGLWVHPRARKARKLALGSKWTLDRILVILDRAAHIAMVNPQ